MNKRNGSDKVLTRTRNQNWTYTMDRIFLDALRNEYDEGNCLSGTFNREAWHRVIEVFNQQTNLDYMEKILKNRLKGLRYTFNKYYSLANRIGWSWDPVRKVPTPKEEKLWDEVISENEHYAMCKDKPFVYYEDLEYLYADRKSSEYLTSATAIVTVKPELILADEGQEAIFAEKSSVHSGESNTTLWTTSPLASMPDETPTPKSNNAKKQHGCAICATPLSTRSTFQHKPTSSKKARTEDAGVGKRVSDSAVQALVDIAELGKKRLQLAQEMYCMELLSKQNLYSLKECIDKLETLPNITPEGIVACSEMLKDEANRYLCMRFSGPVLEKWVERQISVVFGSKSSGSPPKV